MGTGCSRDDFCSKARFGHASCIDGTGLANEAYETVDDGLPNSGEDWFGHNHDARSQHVWKRGHGFRADVAPEFEEELQHAKMALRLPTLIGESALQPRPKKFFDEEPADGERPAQIRAGEGAFPPGLAWCDMDLSEVNVEVEPALAPPPGGVLDLMVRSQQPTCVVLRCNGEDFASFCPGQSYKLFSFECPSEAHVRSVEICLENRQASLQLSPSHGIRLRGKDLQLSLSVHGQPASEEDVQDIEDLAAFTSSLSMQAAQFGCLQPLPQGLSFRAEKSVAFIAFGRTGAEEVDVYLNGLTVPCAAGIRPGTGAAEQRLYRYVVIPVSCEIRSVVIRLRLHGRQGAGLIIDRSFGVRVDGCDALTSTVYVDPKTYVMNPQKSSGLKVEGALQAGCWTWDGFYYLLAYRRSRKISSRNKGASSLRGTMQL